MKSHHMKSHQRTPKGSRRAFLKHLAFFSGAGVLAVNGLGTRAGSAGQVKNLESEKARSAGYRLTPHIEKYYRKAAI